MPFTYKTILLVGATSGIGAGLAEKFVSEGSKVIAVGRRQDRLDDFVKKHGPSKAAAIRFDVTDTGGLDAFVDQQVFPANSPLHHPKSLTSASRVVTQYPDLDCVFLNSGVQSLTRLSRAAEFDLARFHSDINVNFTSIVNLFIKFLPHLQLKETPTGLIVTGTHIALVPAAPMAGYSASKAALTSFIDCARAQNRHKNTKIIEIYPPVVQTEIHDWMGVETGRALGMPLNDFTEMAYQELLKGDELVVIGTVGTEPRENYMELVQRRKEITDNLSKLMLSRFEV